VALEDLQRNLAANLAGGRRAPDGVDPKALERTRAALESKRRQAARRLLPRLHAALGPDWSRRFHQHAAVYNPAGMRHHVDDAWEFAEALLRDPRWTGAARDDLLSLRLYWVRNRKKEAGRIRERRGLLAGLMRSPSSVVIRLPGIRGKVFRFRIRRRETSAGLDTYKKRV
jgi:hypothetical protein